VTMTMSVRDWDRSTSPAAAPASCCPSFFVLLLSSDTISMSYRPSTLSAYQQAS
jgi:hypothetical protein